MYRKANYIKSTIKSIPKYEGETIEEKVRRIIDQKDPIKDGAPIIHTEKKDGVKAEHNVRTDRFEIACEAMDVVHRSSTAKSQDLPKPDKKETNTEEKTEGKKDGGAESVEGTK